MARVSPTLLHPRYWLTWLGFGLWWLLAQLPYRWQMVMGRGLGKLVGRFAKRRRRIAQRNIELCFPELSQAERDRLVQTNLETTLQALFETGIAWFWPHWRLRRLYTIEGLEHLQAAESKGEGVLLLGMHFTNLDIGAIFVSMSHKINALYRPHNNPVYDAIQRWGRQHHSNGGQVIPREDMRQMVRRLRKGEVVWYAPDQDYGPNRPHVFAPFFGVPAATVTATASLVRMGRAQLIPFAAFRRDDGKGYHVKIHPPIEDFPEGDDLVDTTRINHFIEQRILECPHQYMWVHRRFKTRPEGEASLY